MNENTLVGGLEQFLDHTITLPGDKPVKPPVISLYAVKPKELL